MYYLFLQGRETSHVDSLQQAEVVRSSRTSGYFDWITQRHIVEKYIPHSCPCDNLKYFKITKLILITVAV
jgi:hypothetical protein